jgi:O-antigen/teichoic acid export membrane protein
MALTVISGPVLSRLIGPAVYGIVAPAQSIGALGRLVAESGFSYHTVTAKSLTLGEASDLNKQSLRLSVGVASIAALVSGLFLGPLQERLMRAGLTLLLVLFAGAAAVPVAWSQRVGFLGKLEWWGVASQAVATFCIAVPAAYFGLRLFAVNANLLVPLALSIVVAWRFSRLRWFPTDRAKISSAYRFGTLGANFGSYLAGNVDTLLLATYFSPVALGVYTRANLLASLPGTVVSATVARVGLVSLSKSDDWLDHRRFLFKATLLTLAAFSSLAFAAGLGFDATGFAFGRKFSTPPLGFAVLTLSQIFFYGGSLLDMYLNVRRRPALVGVSHSVQAALSGAGFLVLRPQSLLTVSWILLIPSAVRYAAVLAFIYSSRHTPVPANGVVQT